MGILDRLSAIGRSGMDRALSRAEMAVGLRAAPPVQASSPLAAETIPFFPDGTDFFELGHEISKAARPIGISAEPLYDGGPRREPKALENDPFMMVELLGYKERPTGLAYVMLDQMVRRTPIVQAIIKTRVEQVVRHCKPREDRYGIGFWIRHRDSKKSLTKAAKKRAKEIERAIMQTTWGDPGVVRPDFAQFTRQVIRDSLTYDQLCAEVIPSRRGRPYSWKAVDAKTIRLADTATRFDSAASDREIRTVQIIDGQPIHQWPANELIFAIRNPQTSIQSHGYGTSELEMAVHIITALLWAVQYNAKFFSQGSTPKGILNFKGELPAHKLAAFRRFFYQMLAGVENSWRTPVMNAAQGAEWISMHANNRDMEYGNWLDFLIKILSALYLIDSAEFGFKYGNENDRSLFESSNEQKITMSKDKGLKPLLFWYADEVLNSYLVHPADPNFELEFVGMDALTPAEQADLDEKRGRTYLLVDELRAEQGKKPLKDGLGQVINSPTWMQYKQSRDAAEQEAQAQQMGGGPMGPGGPAGAPGDAEGGEQGGEAPDLESLLQGMNQKPADDGMKPVRKSLTSYNF